jgi:two-component system, response regulator
MGGKVILLVVDNRRDEALTLRALKKSNIAADIVVVRDGVEALDYLFSTGSYAATATVLPQMILLDLKLPKLDGLQVLKQVRADARTKRLPVVIFTSSNEEADLTNCYDFGANSYIRKPVAFEQYQEATSQVASYWLLLNQASPPRQ